MGSEKDTIDDIHELIDVENRDDERLVGLIERGSHTAERIVRLTLGD